MAERYILKMKARYTNSLKKLGKKTVFQSKTDQQTISK